MLSWLKQLVTKPERAPTPTPEHLKLAVRQRDIPRYPPFMKGLPLETPRDILSVQGELLHQLYQSTKATREDFQRHYQGAIDRLASFVHLLPASQGHHHRGAGGLLRHSIEVGLWSLREADKMLLLDLCKTPGHRRQIEPRWLLTAFLAGLCHDVGKPATDVVVRNHDSSRQWNPIEQSLFNWGQKEGVDAYFLEWQPGRSKSHIALTGTLAKNIISDATLAWIAGESSQLCLWLMETLNGTPASANPLFDIVVKADQKSVERDLKSMGAVMAGYDLGVPVERMLTDIMRRLIRQGIWSVNEPGAKVWCIEGNVYLVWPTSGQDIATQVIQDGIPGVPRSADSILDMLVERGLAFIEPQGLYKIAPACLSVKIPDIKLNCIRLRDDTLVSSDPLASVDGRVFLEGSKQDASVNVDAAAAHGATGSEAAKNAPTSEKFESTLPAGLTDEKTPKNPGAEVSIGNPTSPSLLPITSAHQEQSSSSLAQKQSDANTAPYKGKQRPQGRSMPTTSNATENIDPSTGEILSGKPQPFPTSPIKQETPATADKSAPLPALQAHGVAKAAVSIKPKLMLDGLVGEALKALAEDLRSGVKRWNQQAFEDPDGRVLLAWPDAFSGYGLTPSSILNDLASRDWCASDPFIPTKKVIEHIIDGKKILVIHLHHDVSEALICEAKRTAVEKKSARQEGQKDPLAKEVEKTNPVGCENQEEAEKPIKIHEQEKNPESGTVQSDLGISPDQLEKRKKKKKQKASDFEKNVTVENRRAVSAPILSLSPPSSEGVDVDVSEIARDTQEEMEFAQEGKRNGESPQVIEIEEIERRKIEAILAVARQMEGVTNETGWTGVIYGEMQKKLNECAMGIGRTHLHKICKENPKILKLDGKTFWFLNKEEGI